MLVCWQQRYSLFCFLLYVKQHVTKLSYISFLVWLQAVKVFTSYLVLCFLWGVVVHTKMKRTGRRLEGNLCFMKTMFFISTIFGFENCSKAIGSNWRLLCGVYCVLTLQMLMFSLSHHFDMCGVSTINQLLMLAFAIHFLFLKTTLNGIKTKVFRIYSWFQAKGYRI